MLKKSLWIIPLLFCTNLLAQTADSSSTPPPSFAINLGIKNHGISIGNSRNWTGIRLNFKDQYVEEINGLNVTLWKAGKNPDAVINGVALGILGPEAKELNGFALGFGVAARSISGTSIGILGLGADNISGFAFGGLGIGCSTFHGIGIGGLGIGGNDMRGLFIGGLGFGGDTIHGVGIAGLGMGGEDLKGIFLAGLGLGGNKVSGFAASLLGIGGNKLSGVAISGFGIGGSKLEGIFLTGVFLKADQLKYFGAAGYVKAKEMTGVSIGILNIANKLNGIQIGAINIAKNNPWPFKVLPFMNVHLK
ncbi:hypothetical protein HQ585_17590 [candidate division KSB1 bacterium]|nr:hypothetical protein [candidate division KSB1 bacterium]